MKRSAHDERDTKIVNIIVVSCVIFLLGGPLAYYGYQAIADEQLINQVIGCRALHGERATESEVRDELQHLRSAFGTSFSESRAVVRGLGC